MPAITADTPAQEIAKRELARRHFIHFIRYVDQRFDPMPPHVPKIAEELQKVVKFIETGSGTPFLILAMPPRHLKTTLVADLLPAWFLGRNPSLKVIDSTYAATLAYDSSKRVRQMIETSERYANIFGERATFLVDGNGSPMPSVDIKQDSRAMDKWVIDQYGGEFLAVGIGGPCTGRGGNLILVDDPTESRADAESKVKRDTVWEYFRSTLYTRRERNAAIVIIMQLWHEDDLVGRIKRFTDPNNTEFITGFPEPTIISLPALAEKGDFLGRKEGEALWPDFMDETELQSIKSTMGDYYFGAQYQQRASSPEGNIFHRNWFSVVPRVPVEYKIQYWDTAEKKGEQNDYWAGVTLGVTKYGILILDIVYRKMTASEGGEEVTRFFHTHNKPEEPVAVIYVEAKSSGSSIVSFLQSGDANLPIEESKTVLDKVARANGVQAYCKARRVQLLQYSTWIQLFLDEMGSFPTGGHDDLPDAVVGGLAKLVHGGLTRPSDRMHRTQRSSSELPTGSEKREKLFGRDGKGHRMRRTILQGPQ
jgi:predicted phage terminase large subunit-like protein